MAASAAHVSSRARGQIGAAVVGLCSSLWATAGSLTTEQGQGLKQHSHGARPGIKPTFHGDYTGLLTC